MFCCTFFPSKNISLSQAIEIVEGIVLRVSLCVVSSV